VLGPEPVVFGRPPSPRALPNRIRQTSDIFLVNLIGHVNGFGFYRRARLARVRCTRASGPADHPAADSVSVLVRLEVIDDFNPVGRDKPINISTKF